VEYCSLSHLSDIFECYFKAEAQSSNVSFSTFQRKETFELSALSSEKADEKVKSFEKVKAVEKVTFCC